MGAHLAVMSVRLSPRSASVGPTTFPFFMNLIQIPLHMPPSHSSSKYFQVISLPSHTPCPRKMPAFPNPPLPSRIWCKFLFRSEICCRIFARVIRTHTSGWLLLRLLLFHVPLIARACLSCPMWLLLLALNTTPSALRDRCTFESLTCRSIDPPKHTNTWLQWHEVLRYRQIPVH